MYIKFLYLLFYLIIIPDSSEITLIDVKQQVEKYVEELDNGNNVELNIWAINEIATLNCESLSMVKSHVEELSISYSEYFNNLNCKSFAEKQFSKDDHIKFWKKEKLQIYKNIVNNQIPLTEDVLDFNQNHFIHFKLLMGSNYRVHYTNDYLTKALSVWIDYIEGYQDEKKIKYSVIISNIIWAAYLLDEYQVIEKYSQEFTDSIYIPYSYHRVRILGAIDYAFYFLGKYHKSLDLQRKHSLPIAKFLNDQDQIDGILLRQGAYLYSIGKYEESKNIYEQLYEKAETSDQQHSLFNNLSINYYKLGHSKKYISFQLSALEQEIPNYQSLLKIYRNLFLYYTTIKDTNTALSYIDKAKDVAKSNNDTTELAFIDSFLGTFYWTNFKDSKKAIKYLESAQEVLTAESNYNKYINLLFEKGVILSKIDSLNASQLIFNEIKELTLSKSDTPNYVDALVNLTEIKLKQNDLFQASEYLKEIKLYSLDNLDFPLLTKYYTVKATYNYKTGNKRAAIAELKPVVDQVIDRAKNNTDSQEGYWSVEDEYLEAFALMVELFMETEAPEEALLLLDQLKTINDASLYNSPLIKGSKLSEEDLVEEKHLNDKLQSLRKKYLNATQEERFAIKIEIDRTSAMREQILAEVNLNKERDLPSVWAVQRSIQSNELVLHFTEVGTHLYVTHLTRDDTKINVYDFPQETQEKFSSIADDLASGNTNLNHLHELYRFLDLSQIPDDINMISVIPDNYLYRIPLEILPAESPDSPISFGSTHYLIEDYSFRYFTSLKEFDSNQRTFNASTENDFSGFGISDFKNFKNTNLPSLPYATVETRNINSVLTSFQQKEIYNEGNATKDAFKRQVGSSRLVHVATHSEVSEQNPLFSTIYLKNSNPGDTLESEQALYAYELFDTPLNSEFIMLNSCSSGSGNYIQGSGVMGISRALRYAGAKSLALNLWSVNDKVASEFATDFYGYLNEGVTKSEAIRKAKLNQLKRSNANPHFWGAYMMIGNPSPITRSSENAFLLFSLLAASILFSGYTTYQKAAA